MRTIVPNEMGDIHTNPSLSNIKDERERDRKTPQVLNIFSLGFCVAKVYVVKPFLPIEATQG